MPVPRSFRRLTAAACLALAVSVASAAAADAVAPPIRVTGNHIQKTVDCSGASNRVVITGSLNRVTVGGRCAQISVTGSSTVVSANKVNTIRLNGSSIKLTYHSSLSGRDAKVVRNGTALTVVRVR